ncbi:MAG: crotonase/enoyl-CoA hydratase family protein [Sandaracinaceae bacterium]|nr:crotonase/enoyl-CoA hydratase family protein [Sandaracinaceae bacterium]
MSEPRVLVSVTDHVATVTLNRPDKRNGLDVAMFEGIIAAGESLAKDTSVRAVVLEGAGKVFCAGLDWGAFLAMGDEGGKTLLARDASSPANVAQRVGWIWQELPVPVIASLHGAAVGGGFQIALGADVRIAHPDTQLSAMEIKYGLIPDMSLTQTLLRLVRPDVAAELVYTGRVLPASEGLGLGLVTRLSDDPRTAAHELAREIATKSPHAIRAGKKLLRGAVGLGPKESFLLETELQLGLLGTPNQMEAVMSVMQKREPTFVD